MTKIFPRKTMALAALALGAFLPLVAGCGGGGRSLGSGGSTASRKIGSMTFRVAWPKPSRLIPVASNAIVINVTRDGQPVVSRTIVKPSDFTDTTPPSTVTFENLEVGDSSSSVPAEQVITYAVTATAYPADPVASPGAVAQATGSITAGLSTNDPAKVVGLTMATTIQSVTITSPTLGTNLGPGRTMTLTATAYDGPGGTGNVVLTTPGTWAWSADRADAGDLSATSGNPVDFTGKVVPSPVTTVVTVKETESNVSTSTNLLTVPVGLQASAWPKFHGNQRNQGLATGDPAVTSTPSLVAGWNGSQAGGSVVFSSPVVGADGTVYVGAYDGKVYAFNPGGSVKWTFQTGGAIEATPLVSRDGTVFVGSNDKKMYALRDNGASAGLIWSFEANGPIFGSATIDKDGYLYFAAADPDNRVFCVDSLNGKAKKVGANAWVFTASAGVQSAPTLNDAETALYVADVNGAVYSVATATATANWSYDSGSTVYSSAPALANVGGKDCLFFGTVEGKLHAVDAATGALVWADAVDLEGQIYSTPAISANGSVVYVATFDNTSGLDRSRVLALNTADGTMVWNEATIPSFNPGFTSSPALSTDGTVLYIGCYDGKVYGVATADGSVAWTYDPGVVDEYFDSSPGVGADGTIYIGGVTGRVYAIK